MTGRNLNRRFLIVGEGRKTEYNYFVGLRTASNIELRDMAISIKVARGKGGNARQIVRSAIAEMKKFDPNWARGDRVFLCMDTEGIGRAPELPEAELLAKNNKIEIIYSSPSIEFWLLCHFPSIPRGYLKDCDATVTILNKHWNSELKVEYDKADLDIFKRLKDRLPLARQQALEIDLGHSRIGAGSSGSNPSSQIHELVGRLIGVPSGWRCPVAGKWERIGLSGNPICIVKGDPMPECVDKATIWKLQ